MSDIRVNNISNEAGTGRPTFPYGLVATTDVLVGGALTITGNFNVDGTQTIVNTSTLDVADKTVGIASTTSANNTTADGAGIEIYASSGGAGGGPNNNKTLTWNNGSGAFEYNVPNKCPECESKKLLFKGYGTERIEHELRKIFPNANIGYNINATRWIKKTSLE